MPSPARAQAVAPSPSPTPVAEIGRVSTSDRQDEPADQTARVTYTVTKAQMLLHGDDNVASALDRVPGVYVQHFGGPGAAAEITVNGQRTDGNLILLDGRPVSGGGIGVIDLASMPTAGIERIEVVEGAGATLYGNGASSSVINIITTRSNAAYTTPIVSVAGGSYGYGRAISRSRARSPRTTTIRRRSGRARRASTPTSHRPTRASRISARSATCR
jgi:outer membrane cobalamin receptor